MITRFAPSPTGRLHLGHAYSAMLAHDTARAVGGQFLLRMDDLDIGRVRPEFYTAIEEDLAWLGIDADGQDVLQSQRTEHYTAALEQLKTMGLAYPCFCTRAQIAADIADSVAAPHGASPLYPGSCRGMDPSEQQTRITNENHCWRIDMARAVAQTGPLYWHDMEAGLVNARPADQGDSVLMRKDGAASYHLSSTIDDADMGITHVVRGADLFDSTHIHRLLQALLGFPTPHYHHHALIGGADGKRLAKRDGAAEIAHLRAAGADPAQLMAGLRMGALPLGYCWVKP
jgi:glutamyl-Q tRNA(Asp) synthetase